MKTTYVYDKQSQRVVTRTIVRHTDNEAEKRGQELLEAKAEEINSTAHPDEKIVRVKTMDRNRFATMVDHIKRTNGGGRVCSEQIREAERSPAMRRILDYE